MNDKFRKFEVFKEVKVYSVVFRVVIESCRVVDGYQCMKGSHCLHIQASTMEMETVLFLRNVGTNLLYQMMMA
jgi:hypothetical protein